MRYSFDKELLELPDEVSEEERKAMMVLTDYLHGDGSMTAYRHLMAHATLLKAALAPVMERLEAIERKTEVAK